MLLARNLFLCGAALLLAAGCSCSESDPDADAPIPLPAYSGAPIDLLARKPDAVAEIPGPIEPQGDTPGSVTFGPSEGPGWSQTDLRLPDGTHYRVTNQARAELILPATRPAERELVFQLWCVRPAGAEPERVHVLLNGIDLAPEGLAPGREPGELRVRAPEPAWVRGANRLELSVPVRERDGLRAWDALALARLDYGPAARATIAIDTRTASFADGAGARYALELAHPARLDLAGKAAGPGELRVRLGTLDPRSGALEMETGFAESVFATRDGRVVGQVPIARHAGAVRVLELEWYAPDGPALELTRLELREREPAQRPSIVFVSIDTFAARHLALYGYGRATSPELERFQRDAVLFERCLANAPWTLPSYLSVLSGLYPRAHALGLEFQVGSDIGPDDLWQLADNRWTLAEALRARGYCTAGFVDTWWLSPRYRVNQGFDNYNGDAAMARFEDPHAHIEHIVERLVPPWLATTSAERPPFLFLHALDAHGPYLPNAPWRDEFVAELAPERTEVPAGSDNQTYRWMPWWMSRTLTPDEAVSEPATVPLEEVVARYDESLLKVDAYLGKLFALLRARGLYDQAVIVVTGDHGEHFGPGMYGHGIMRESVLHVPLLVKLPGNAHGGERVRAPVALVDVYPTLLELAGVPADETRLHGSSLLAHLAQPAASAERALYSEGGHVEQYALTLGCWRLVEEFPGSESSEASLLSHPRVPEEWLRAHCPELPSAPLTKALLAEILARPGMPERIAELRALVAGPYYTLFDLCADPHETRDLSAERPAELARLKAALAREKARSRTARAEARVTGVLQPPSPEQREQLEALGYGGSASEEDSEDAEKKKKKPEPEPDAQAKDEQR